MTICQTQRGDLIILLLVFTETDHQGIYFMLWSGTGLIILHFR